MGLLICGSAFKIAFIPRGEFFLSWVAINALGPRSIIPKTAPFRDIRSISARRRPLFLDPGHLVHFSVPTVISLGKGRSPSPPLYTGGPFVELHGLGEGVVWSIAGAGNAGTPRGRSSTCEQRRDAQEKWFLRGCWVGDAVGPLSALAPRQVLLAST